MKLNRILLFGLIFSTRILIAQTDFRQGYIIKESGDTLYGQIDYRGDLLMGEVCRFRANDNSDEIKYSPTDIVAYRFNESKYFVSKEVNGAKVFMEFLFKGQINFYYLRNSTGDHYFLEKKNSQIVELPYQEGVKDVGDKIVYFETKKHIGILNYYLQDAPNFQSRIAQTRKPEHRSLIKLAEDYHNKVCKDSTCIIYVKKTPWIKVNVEIVGGILKYQNPEFKNNTNSFQTGILTHIGMPRTSEKLYFRTGILHSTLKENKVNKAIFKIPIQLEYIYPKGIIRPIFAFGINMYSPAYHSVAFMGGANFRIDKTHYFSLNYDIDFNPNETFQLLPKSFLSQSILIGYIVTL